MCTVHCMVPGTHRAQQVVTAVIAEAPQRFPGLVPSLLLSSPPLQPTLQPPLRPQPFFSFFQPPPCPCLCCALPWERPYPLFSLHPSLKPQMHCCQPPGSLPQPTEESPWTPVNHGSLTSHHTPPLCPLSLHPSEQTSPRYAPTPAPSLSVLWVKVRRECKETKGGRRERELKPPKWCLESMGPACNEFPSYRNRWDS